MGMSGTVDVANARIDLFVDWTPTPGTQTSSTVVRRVGNANAPDEYVRGLFGTTLLGEQAYLSDHEAPLDEPIWYVAVANDTSDFFVAGPFTIPSNGYVWLKDPGRPWADLRLDLCPNPSGAVICPPTPPIEDTFTRTVAAGAWGNTDTGQTWVNTSGSATDYSVSGGFGRHDMLTVSTSRRSAVTQPQADADIRADIAFTQVPTGNDIHGAIMARAADGNNMYMARLEVRTDATVWASVVRRSGGVNTILGTLQIGTGYTANQLWSLRFNVTGSMLRLRAWLASNPEPTGWMLELSDATFTAASTVGLRSERVTGNTNTGLVVLYDNFSVSTVTAPDPLIAWVGFQDRDRDDDAGLFPVLDKERPADVYARRKDVTTGFSFLSRTLEAIRLVYDLFTAGGPLLVQVPAEYGMDAPYEQRDRYYQPATLREQYISRDQRMAPRLWSVPATAVDAPIGQPQGTDTANWCALADSYRTYADFTATGFTWGQAATGQASTAPVSGLYGGGTYGGGFYGG
jgi:hypothetical protein